jgi:hypothetical protein
MNILAAARDYRLVISDVMTLRSHAIYQRFDGNRNTI